MSIIKFETIENKLIKYNNEWVLLDKDVATLYEVEPKKLRQQVKQNIDKFPSDYASQLSEADLDLMVSQNVTPSKQHFGGSLPYVFTEKSLYMVATILKSKKATEAIFATIETFAKVKELSKNISAIMKTEDEAKQKELAKKSNKILEEIIELEPESLSDDEDGELIGATANFEFNLGFAKVSRSIKKIKK